jgi:hypothetical protein
MLVRIGPILLCLMILMLRYYYLTISRRRRGEYKPIFTEPKAEQSELLLRGPIKMLKGHFSILK